MTISSPLLCKELTKTSRIAHDFVPPVRPSLSEGIIYCGINIWWVYIIILEERTGMVKGCICFRYDASISLRHSADRSITACILFNPLEVLRLITGHLLESRPYVSRNQVVNRLITFFHHSHNELLFSIATRTFSHVNIESYVNDLYICKKIIAKMILSE